MCGETVDEDVSREERAGELELATRPNGPTLLKQSSTLPLTRRVRGGVGVMQRLRNLSRDAS